MKTRAFLDLTKTRAGAWLRRYEYPWEILPDIGSIIMELGNTLPEDRYLHPAEDLWIAVSATVAPSASITGPCIIDEGAEVRHCAFIRGNALVGREAVVGNSTELKNVILFDRVQVPHYNYVGDSILGYGAHMGAGAVTSNVKGDKKPVVIHGGEEIATGLRKMGAILGDGVEVGCGSVLNPGTLIGRGSRIYPLCSVRGIVPAHHIYKDEQHVIPLE